MFLYVIVIPKVRGKKNHSWLHSAYSHNVPSEDCCTEHTPVRHWSELWLCPISGA